MEIKGKLLFRNNQVYICDSNHEINLFVWLASYGLKNKQVLITIEVINDRD
jgi:sulfur relay (sulfurtransferase) DsrF/TusC family protein